MARPACLALCVLALAPLAACAPTGQNSTVAAYSVGQAGAVQYGTIVGMRPVQVTGSRSGLGTAGGAVGGALIGSTIGGDWRARTVGGVAGALLGGLAGTAVEEGVTGGQAVEFIVRTDNGPDQAIIQSNEGNLQVGDRVALTYTDRVRIIRATDAPLVGAYDGRPGTYGGVQPGYRGEPIDYRGQGYGGPAYGTPVYGGRGYGAPGGYVTGK